MSFHGFRNCWQSSKKARKVCQTWGRPPDSCRHGDSPLKTAPRKRSLLLTPSSLLLSYSFAECVSHHCLQGSRWSARLPQQGARRSGTTSLCPESKSWPLFCGAQKVLLRPIGGATCVHPSKKVTLGKAGPIQYSFWLCVTSRASSRSGSCLARAPHKER